jgi:flagellar basal body P-ring formation protein FlgA
MLKSKFPFACVAALAALGATGAVAAQTTESVARDTVLEALSPALAARGATVRVDVATADAHRVAAPCARMVGFIPPGARLVGKTLVGVKCLDGASWQTFVALDVHIEAPVWQAVRVLRPGEPLAAADLASTMAPLTTQDLDAASGRGNTLSRGFASLDGRQPPPVGRTLQRQVAPGHALVATDIREEGRVNAGESVRVVYQGEGFAISTEGRTVAPADPGASVQIRLASGSVVSGTLRADRQVEMAR